MDRPAVRHGVVLVLLLVVAVLPILGCQGALMTAAILLKGTDIEPDFAGLKGKKVAVVCRPVATSQYQNASVARDLAQQVTLLLQQRVPKIHTVDQRKVAAWTDENTWEDFTEVGKAMKADIVVGIDLENFSIYEGQTLYKGKANVTVHVIDCKKGSKVVFEKTLPQTVFPPNSSVPTSDRQEAEFRHEFELFLADQIGRHFYAHDRFADTAQDTLAL